MKLYEHLDLLGKKVEDRVTRFKGVVSSVCFDLYGCIQVSVNPGVMEDGRLGDQAWFDITRLRVVSNEQVMELPDFIAGAIADGKRGPAEKPRFSKA